MAVELPNLARSAPINFRREGINRAATICFISETLEAGVGRYVEEVATGLAERKHQVVVIYSPRRADPVSVRNLSQIPGMNCHAIDIPQAITWRDAIALCRVIGVLRGYDDIRLIHGHSAKGGAYARLLGFVLHIPAIYTPHAFITQCPDLSVPKRLIYTFIERILAKLGHTVACVSQAELRHARALGIRDTRLRLMTVATPRFPMQSREAIRSQLGIAETDVVIGFIGRMVSQKAPERFIAALQSLLPLLSNVRAVIIGDGTKRKTLERLIEEGGLSHRVSWLGAVDGRKYLCAFDIFAITSRYEGFAYVLLEALEAGLPMVSTPVGGTDEAIAEGVNGYIVPDGDAPQLHNALMTLATDPELRSKMSEAARAKRLAFDFPRVLDQLELLYGDVDRTAEQRDRYREGIRKRYLPFSKRKPRPVSAIHFVPGRAAAGASMEHPLAREIRHQINLKRWVDILFACIALIFFGPVMIPASLVLMLSGSRIIAENRRIGLHGVPFSCYKFNTATGDPDSDRILDRYLREHPVAMRQWIATRKLTHDPRTARFGQFLQSTGIAELPQLFNVLRGEMSIVGPKPIEAGEVKQYSRFIRHYYSCRPGLTGLWHITARENARYPKQVCLDALYARRQSFLFDAMIMVRSLLVAIVSKQPAQPNLRR